MLEARIVLTLIILVLCLLNIPSVSKSGRNIPPKEINYLQELPPPPGELYSKINYELQNNKQAQIQQKPNYKVIQNQDTMKVPVIAGWNLISVPVDAENKTKEALFPSAVSPAYSYFNGYYQVDSLYPGKGYWLKFSQPETLSLAGNKIYEITSSINGGWNLVGSVCKPISKDSVRTNPQGIVSSNYFGFGQNGYYQSQVLEPGYAYWLKSRESGEMNLKVTRNLEQKLLLDNYVNIKYNAKLTNIDSAFLKIFKDSLPEPVFEKTIKDTSFLGNDFEIVLNYSQHGITKGTYKAILTPADSSLLHFERKDSLNIPNYLPSVNLYVDYFTIDMDEEETIKRKLPTPTDRNPEDNPVPYINVTTDGKSSAFFNSTKDSLIITGNKDATGPYSIQLSFGSQQGGTKTQERSGFIYDMLDVQGVLEDNENHQRWPGTIKVYNSNNVLLGEFSVDNSGTFDKQLPYRVSSLTANIFVQGRRIQNNGADTTSYIRTIKSPKKDLKNLEMVVVPYDSLSKWGITKEDFKKFCQEVTNTSCGNQNCYVQPTTNSRLWRWNFGEFPEAGSLFNEIIISRRNPDYSGLPNPDTAYFSQATAESIKARILDPNDLGAWIRGKISDPNKIKIVDTAWVIQQPRDWGRIIIHPAIISSAWVYYDPNGDGYIDLSRVRVSATNTGNLISPLAIIHELGHAYCLGGHNWTLPDHLTIMSWVIYPMPWLPNIPRPADKKIAKIIYEDSYKHGTGSMIYYSNYDMSILDALGLWWGISWVSKSPPSEKEINQHKDKIIIE